MSTVRRTRLLHPALVPLIRGNTRCAEGGAIGAEGWAPVGGVAFVIDRAAGEDIASLVCPCGDLSGR